MLRTGIVSMALVTIIMMVTLVDFNNKLVEMSAVLDTMNQKFSSVSNNMGQMRFVIKRIDQNIMSLPDSVDETGKMTAVVQAIIEHDQ